MPSHGHPEAERGCFQTRKLKLGIRNSLKLGARTPMIAVRSRFDKPGNSVHNSGGREDKKVTAKRKTKTGGHEEKQTARLNSDC